jgi:cytochrome P450
MMKSFTLMNFVAVGLTWTLFHLASRQDIQQKCRDEVRALLRGSSEIAYADLNNLTYLTQCIKESLRMCPPVPYIGRELIEPIELPDGRVIPGGTSVFCGIRLLHYNNEVWPNPDVYDPSRFEPQACNDRPPHAYVPFSSGPRNCIGQAFAMNVMKVAVALLLSKYTFAVDVSRDFQFQHDIIMRPRDGLHLLIKPVDA